MKAEQTLDKTSNGDHRATPVLDPRASGLPRGLFLIAAALSFALSVVLFFAGDKVDGIFVGLWVPSILALGALLVPRPTGWDRR